MRSPLLKSVFLVTGFFIYTLSSVAQELPDSRLNRIDLSVQHLSYMRNYEYFNDIQKGYTLFGNTLTPVLRFAATHTTYIETGAFLQYDFGTTQFRRVLPALAFVAGNKHHFMSADREDPSIQQEWNVRLGSLDNSRYHSMPEALYNRDQIIFNPLEYGGQFRFHNKQIQAEQWLQWQRMIYADSKGLEALQAGAALYVKSRSDTTKLHLIVPLYTMAHHRGGQIGFKDSTDVGGTTLNLSGGIILQMPLSSYTYIRTGAQYYWSRQNNTINTSNPPRGRGTEITVQATHRNLGVGIQYWQAQDFLAPYGRYITQSNSSVFTDNPTYIKNRQLLFLKANYNYKIVSNLSLNIELEPYYDVREKLLEYAYHLLLRYNFDMALYRANKKP